MNMKTMGMIFPVADPMFNLGNYKMRTLLWKTLPSP